MDKNNIIKNLFISENIYNEQNIYCDSVGVESPDLYLKGRFFSRNQLISQVYLTNFENTFKMGQILGTGDFMSNPINILPLVESSYKEDTQNCILLKKPRKMNVSLQNALLNRESSRLFIEKEISFQDFSDFLYYSAGSIRKNKFLLGNQTFLKNKYSYPSGGGIYSIKLFLIVYNVQTIEPAVYIYQPNSHSILKYCEIKDLDNFIVTKRYNKNLGDYETIEELKPSALICCVNNFSQQRLKYGELSLALAYTDCGCLLQNCSLLASALNLNYCIWAGFKKNNAEHCLKIDGFNNHIIMMSLLGIGE